MDKQIDLKKYSNEWVIYNFDQNQELVFSLQKYLKNNEVKKIIEFFKDFKAIRSLIVWRGSEGEYLKLVITGFDEILKYLQVDYGDSKKIIQEIKKLNISEEVLFFCVEAAYHLRDKERFDLFCNIILENKDILNEKRVYYRVLHHLASWKEAIEHKTEESIELNMEVIANTKDIDPVFYLKAKFGLSYNKSLAPKQKAKDFLNLVEEFKKYNDLPDSFRATVEAARAILDLSRQQGVDDIAFENIDYAKGIALESLKIAKDIGYPNLEIIAGEVMSSIYQERLKKIKLVKKNIEDDKSISKEYKQKYEILAKTFKDDNKKEESYRKRTEDLRMVYGYNTKFNNQYKESYFNHI